VDLLYRPGATPFQTGVRDAGGVALGGLGFLLQQAAISFELWTGRSAPLPVMSAAALGELSESGPAPPGATGTV
jgi:shikimate dehydrogenase